MRRTPTRMGYGGALVGCVALLLVAGCRQPEDPTLAQIRDRAQRHPESAEAWTALGEAYREQDRFNEAFIAFRRALDNDRRHAQALRGIADTARQLHDPDTGLEYVVRALELNPHDALARGLRGQLLLAKGEVEKALPDLQRALDEEPNQVETHLALVTVYTLRQRMPEALKQAAQAARLFPGQARVHYVHATLLEADNQPQEAKAAYRRALSQDPDLARAKFRLASLLVRLREELPEARALALEVAEVDRGDGTPQGLAAWALYLQDRREPALQELLSIWQEHPQNMWVLLRIRQASREMGNRPLQEATEQVIQRLQAAAGAQPQSPEE